MIYFDTKSYLDNLQATPVGRQFDYRKPLDSGNWTAWKEEFRSKLSEKLGMHLIDRNAGSLHPRCVETRQLPGYTVEKRYISSEPGIEIPFYLLLPDGEGPFPLVITPHGHGRRGKEVYIANYESEEEEKEALAGDRDIARQAVREGYAVIAPDVRGFWEMAREEDMAGNQSNSCAELQRSAMMYGRTLIGERVHDMGRLIDYAQTRSEVDTNQIIITGNSGGGTVSLFTAALDERIRMVIPGSYFCTFQDSIISLSHCACNLVPGIMQLGEMYDVAGLIAPRPILVVHGRHDPIYPIEGTRQAFTHLQEIYDALGQSRQCELYEGSGGHRFYKERVWSFVKERL
jgi:dienelactone hydrolase